MDVQTSLFRFDHAVDLSDVTASLECPCIAIAILSNQVITAVCAMSLQSFVRMMHYAASETPSLHDALSSLDVFTKMNSPLLALDLQEWSSNAVSDMTQFCLRRAQDASHVCDFSCFLFADNRSTYFMSAKDFENRLQGTVIHSLVHSLIPPTCHPYSKN